MVFIQPGYFIPFFVAFGAATLHIVLNFVDAYLPIRVFQVLANTGVERVIHGAYYVFVNFPRVPRQDYQVRNHVERYADPGEDQTSGTFSAKKR